MPNRWFIHVIDSFVIVSNILSSAARYQVIQLPHGHKLWIQCANGKQFFTFDDKLMILLAITTHDPPLLTVVENTNEIDAIEPEWCPNYPMAEIAPVILNDIIRSNCTYNEAQPMELCNRHCFSWWLSTSMVIEFCRHCSYLSLRISLLF